MYRVIPTDIINVTDFMSRTVKNGDCTIWTGSKYRNGYGKYGRKGYPAHRIAYELLKGSVPIDMCLDHLCKNRLCVNPLHLEVVTLVENVMRGESQHAKNARKTHCTKGHEFTVENTYTRPDRTTRECRICRNAAVRKHIIASERGK